MPMHNKTNAIATGDGGNHSASNSAMKPFDVKRVPNHPILCVNRLCVNRYDRYSESIRRGTKAIIAPAPPLMRTRPMDFQIG